MNKKSLKMNLIYLKTLKTFQKTKCISLYTFQMVGLQFQKIFGFWVTLRFLY